MRITDQAGQQNIQLGEEGGQGSARCPSCRGKIDVKKIIDYFTFKRVHQPNPGNVAGADEDGDGDDSMTDDEESNSDYDSDSDSDSESDSDLPDLKDFIVPDDESSDAASGNPLEKTDKKETSAKKKKKKKAKVKGKGKEKEKAVTMAQLKREAMKNARNRRRYMHRLEEEWQPSAKVDKCCELLQEVCDRKEEEKTIVFSQFTTLLDLLEIPISRKEWGYTRYDGSMTAEARNNAVIKFTDDPSCKIMLVSLKAGNAGLNLTVASQVIIFDPFWNPYIEEQAIDRAHRIGQQRPVKVHRILVENTVEDRIITLQEKKRKLIEAALDEKASKDIGRLGVKELGFLFVSDPTPKKKNSIPKIS
jgi:SNF2 family DNA or RNA helicase